MDTDYRITRGERRQEKRACKRRERNYHLAAERKEIEKIGKSRRKGRKEKEVWISNNAQ